MFKTPVFWKKKGFLSSLLIPFSYFYYFSHILVSKIKKEIKIEIPVICVGNAVVGGSGKTPVVIELRKILKKKFSNIFVLTRGYSGQNKGPLVVNNQHNFLEVGDESVLHSKFGKTCMSKNKIKGANLCKKKNADLLILDDGLQSKNLKKNVSILVIDGNYMFGNQRLLPAGPLRETIKRSIETCDVILIIGNTKLNEEDFIFMNKKIFFAKKIMKIKNLKSKNLIAFSGLGNNENFLNGLENLGLNVKKFFEFSDHHKYELGEIQKILDIAKNKKLSVVTTMKDFVRVPNQLKKKINIVDLKIKIANESGFFDYISKRLL